MSRIIILFLLLLLATLGFYLFWLSQSPAMNLGNGSSASRWQANESSYQVVEKLMRPGGDFKHPTQEDMWGRALVYHAPTTFFIRVRGADSGNHYLFEVPQRAYYGTPGGSKLSTEMFSDWQHVQAPYAASPPDSFYADTEATQEPQDKETSAEQEKLEVLRNLSESIDSLIPE